MRKALIELLNNLDNIQSRFEEVGDTDVREQMREAIENGVITPSSGYMLPDEFGMFEPEGNEAVMRALAQFIVDANLEATIAGLKTREARLRAFQDESAESKEGSVYDDYFGYDDSLEKSALHR